MKFLILLFLLIGCQSPIQPSIRSYELIESMTVNEFRQLRTRTANTNISWRSTNQSILIVRSVGAIVQVTAVGKGTAQVVGSDDYDPTRLEIFKVEVK